jgi:flagellar hook-basal body complex protein FliE
VYTKGAQGGCCSVGILDQFTNRQFRGPLAFIGAVYIEGMTVMPLQPDSPIQSPYGSSPSASQGGSSFGTLVCSVLGSASAALERAAGAEHAFAHGRGGLQEMMVERAQADVALSIATTAASRATQAASAILGMQV